MAYTNAPQNQTYKSEVIKFDDTSTYRSGNLSIQRDSALVNLFYDRVSQENKTREVFLKKRPGLSTTSYSLNKNSVHDVLRGHYYDSGSNRFYWAVNDKVYYIAPDTGTTTNTVASLTTASGYVGFCEFLIASTMKRYIVFSDGQELWLDEIGGTAAKVTDADLPVPHVPQPAQIDGYLFVADSETNNIHNSEVDNPWSWVAGDFISAEMEGDFVIKLAVNRNYLIAFGEASLEFFWDAANESGSPMKRNESGFKRVGYVSNLCEIGDMLYFVGQDKNKSQSVFRLDGFKLERISDEVVDRTIQTTTTIVNEKSHAYLDKNGFSISVDGHTFYCLPTDQTTWMFDVDEKLWYEWKDWQGTGLGLQASWGMYNGGQYVATKGEASISRLSPLNYQDFGENFTCKYVTQDFNFGTLNWKTCNRLILNADMHTYTGSSLVTVTWSDNDWGDGGTSSGTVNVFSSSPYITRLGRFRTRSFKLEYADNYPLRLRGMELDINVGNI